MLLDMRAATLLCSEIIHHGCCAELTAQCLLAAAPGPSSMWFTSKLSHKLVLFICNGSASQATRPIIQAQKGRDIHHRAGYRTFVVHAHCKHAKCNAAQFCSAIGQLV
jgi:hypothetical protein